MRANQGPKVNRSIKPARIQAEETRNGASAVLTPTHSMREVIGGQLARLNTVTMKVSAVIDQAVVDARPDTLEEDDWAIEVHNGKAEIWFGLCAELREVGDSLLAATNIVFDVKRSSDSVSPRAALDMIEEAEKLERHAKRLRMAAARGS